MSTSTPTATDTTAVVDTPNSDVIAQGKLVSLRKWRMSDVPSMTEQANNRKIWINLRDRFPHPYSEEDARRWIAFNTPTTIPGSNTQVVYNFAICRNEDLSYVIGGIGIARLEDVYKRTAEIGYWLGEAFWGRGYATEALVMMTKYAFETFADLERIEAGVYARNPASCRVLEKAGYTFEACRKKRIFKDGEFIDEHMYAIWRQ